MTRPTRLRSSRMTITSSPTLLAISGYLVPDRVQECWNDARFYRDELRALFRRGHVDLRQMARAERIYLNLMARIKDIARGTEQSGDLDKELQKIADVYHCNFSVFQSLPDVWAIDQLHPIMPLQMLDQEPDRRAVLSDITCDSDGKMDKFILATATSRRPCLSIRCPKTSPII